MELEITKTKEIPLLSRKRISCIATFDKETPKRIDVNQKVAAILGVNPDLVVTRHIYTKFGEKKAKVIAHIYSSIDDLNANEDMDIVNKNKGIKKEKKAKASKAEKKA